MRLDENKKKFKVPVCIHCGVIMQHIASEQYQFIGYRCQTHQDFYMTSIFMNAIADIYSSHSDKLK